MAKVLLTVFLGFIVTCLNFFLAPINLVIDTLFPSFATYIGTYNMVLTDYVGPMVGYVFHILPPLTRALIVFWFGFMITFYTVTYSLHAILKIKTMIHNIKG